MDGLPVLSYSVFCHTNMFTQDNNLYASYYLLVVLLSLAADGRGGD